jgi:probable F420-dependent oxidoreductase
VTEGDGNPTDERQTSAAPDGDLRPLRVFVRVPHAWCHASVAALDEVAQAAEELGFDGISVQDHILSDASVTPCGRAHGGDDRTVFEALGVLTWLAGRTSQIRLLTGVLVVPWRDPILTAKETATLDVLSGGRLVLGVGIGALVGASEDGQQRLNAHARLAQREFSAMGVRGDRGPRTDEFLAALVALWTREGAAFRGEHIAFEAIDLIPRPVQQPHPPIWIGGRSAAALRRVARFGNGWFPSQASVDLIRAGRAAIAAHAAQIGRPVPVDQGVNLFASIGDADEAAYAAIADALGPRFATREALTGATIAGRPDTVLRRIAAYCSAGVNAIDLKLLPLGTVDTIGQMRRLALDVLPAIAGRQGAGAAG